MKNFVVFFTEKEGTSPLMRLLDNFQKVSIVHQVNNSGWEPFDRHNCGQMSLRNLERCLQLIFENRSEYSSELNDIYTTTAKSPLCDIGGGGITGFKMRFTPPRNQPSYMATFAPWRKSYQKYVNKSFRRMMIELLRRNNVVVFIAVRQDALRWALSKYHGDGTGRPGHMQFKLASGDLRRSEIEKIEVDCIRLEQLVLQYESELSQKRQLIVDLRSVGVKTEPLLYEEFLADKYSYFSQLLQAVGLDVSREDISDAIAGGEYFTKVHSDDISEFVKNHEEVNEKFADRFDSWR